MKNGHDYKCPLCGRAVKRFRNGTTPPHGKRRYRHKCPHGTWCVSGHRLNGQHANHPLCAECRKAPDYRERNNLPPLEEHARTPLDRLWRCAQAWQQKHDRNLQEVVAKLEEEIAEFWKTNEAFELLDETGDVVVTALRALVTLAPNELEFLVRVMEMKVERRTGPGGVKNKVAEADHVAELVQELLGRFD
jgi:hypothetical protein